MNHRNHHKPLRGGGEYDGGEGGGRGGGWSANGVFRVRFGFGVSGMSRCAGIRTPCRKKWCSPCGRSEWVLQESKSYALLGFRV